MIQSFRTGPIGLQPQVQAPQGQGVQPGGHPAQGAQGQAVAPQSWLSGAMGYGSQIASSLISGGGSLVSGSLSLSQQVISSTVSMGIAAKDGLVDGASYLGGKAIEGAVAVKDGVSYLGGKAIEGAIVAKDGALYVGGKAVEGAIAVKDGALYVGGKAVEGAIVAKDGAVHYGGIAKDTAIGVGTKGFEKIGGTAMHAGAVALRHLPYTTDKTTLFGSLPNSPGFTSALTQKSAQLDGTFKAALGGAQVHEQAVLNALDNALTTANQTLQGGHATSGGKLSSQDFHGALLLGGHFVKEDGSALYNQLRHTQNSSGSNAFTARSSSHYKGVPDQQFGMDLPGGLGHLLIGKTDQGHTFFQLESHGVGNPNQSFRQKVSDTLGHTQAYMQHISGDAHYVQIGPQGCISASEKDGQHVILR